jgi:hypothetical protein
MPHISRCQGGVPRERDTRDLRVTHVCGTSGFLPCCGQRRRCRQSLPRCRNPTLGSFLRTWACEIIKGFGFVLPKKPITNVAYRNIILDIGTPD